MKHRLASTPDLLAFTSQVLGLEPYATNMATPAMFTNFCSAPYFFNPAEPQWTMPGYLYLAEPLRFLFYTEGVGDMVFPLK